MEGTLTKHQKRKVFLTVKLHDNYTFALRISGARNIQLNPLITHC